MNYRILFFSVLCVPMAINACSSPCLSTGAQSFFRGRPISQNASLELALHNFYLYDVKGCEDECRNWLTVQPTLFYFRSTNDHTLATYFMPGGKACAVVGQNNASDISSPWLGLNGTTAAPFLGQFCISPRRQVIGGALKFHVDIGSLMDDSCSLFAYLWASVFIPVAQVRHDLGLCQTIKNPGVAPGFTDIISALNNRAWNVGRLPAHVQKKTGFDDIQIKLGSPIYIDAYKHIGLYLVAYAPVSKPATAHSLFEPTLGNGGHAGVGGGITADYTAWEHDSSTFRLMFDWRYAYFFPRHEWRSFDLALNGDWSRYLLVARPDDLNTPLPGINFFTQRVRVSPRSSVDAWQAFHFTRDCFHLEIGYDLWWRQQEHIDDLCNPGVVIFNIVPAVAERTSSSLARISQGARGFNAPSTDIDPELVNSRDLNISNAQLPTVLTSTLYLAVAYDIVYHDNVGMIGAGISYERDHKHVGMSQLGAWVKAGVAF